MITLLTPALSKIYGHRLLKNHPPPTPPPPPQKKKKKRHNPKIALIRKNMLISLGVLEQLDRLYDTLFRNTQKVLHKRY